MRWNRTTRSLAITGAVILVSLAATFGRDFTHHPGTHPKPSSSSSARGGYTPSSSGATAGLTPTSSSSSGADSVDVAAIAEVSRGFASIVYSYSYKDAPGTIASQVRPYVVPGFTDLPGVPSPTSNAGMALQASHTEAAAVVLANGFQLDGIGGGHALVTITVTVATSSDSQSCVIGDSTCEISFPRVLSMVKSHGVWLVSSVTEG